MDYRNRFSFTEADINDFDHNKKLSAKDNIAIINKSHRINGRALSYSSEALQTETLKLVVEEKDHQKMKTKDHYIGFGAPILNAFNF